MCARWVFGVGCLLWCSAGFSQESVVVVSHDGTQAWFAASASDVAILASRVVRLEGPGGGDPPPPPPPPPPPSDLSRLAAMWRTKVASYPDRDRHRAELEAMYRLLAGQVASGRIDSLDALKSVTTQLRGFVLGGDVSKWGIWGRDVGVYLDEHVSSVSDAGSAYADIALGLSGENAVSPEFWDFLLRLLELLLAIFGGGGDGG